jgi:hypothetical protein
MSESRTSPRPGVNLVSSDVAFEWRSKFPLSNLCCIVLPTARAPPAGSKCYPL